MSDGHRTITLTLTEAQYDVFSAAMEQAREVWKPLGRIRSSDVQTLERAMSRLSESWKNGVRK